MNGTTTLLTDEDLTHKQLSDLRYFGFAVAASRRYAGECDRLYVLWNEEGRIIERKPVPGVEVEAFNEARDIVENMQTFFSDKYGDEDDRVRQMVHVWCLLNACKTRIHGKVL